MRIFDNSKIRNKTMAMEEPEKVMPLTEHLEELRWRILKALGSLVLFALLSFPLTPSLLDLLARPVGQLYFFAPTEAFFIRIKLAFVMGLVISAPLILYEIWAFVLPALTKREKNYALPLVLSSTLLFILGILFAYFFLLPVAIKVLLSFGTESLQELMGVTRYTNFVLWTLLGCGIVFEIPVIIFFLTRLGLLSPEFLIRRWKESLLLIFILSALITPSIDMVTQVLLALPLTLLYLISLLVSFLARRQGSI